MPPSMARMRRSRPFCFVSVLAASFGACDQALEPRDSVNEPAILVGAGDIAACDSQGDEQTAALLDSIPGTVFTAGDNVYESGTPEEFANCYDPSWGRHKARTRPAPGNHEYATAGAAGYFAYFGESAGEPGKGYYSYDVGAWHVVVLNTMLDMGPGSAQEQWLRADLSAHDASCTLAYGHHPRFSSGPYGNDSRLQAVWEALYQAGAEVLIFGHSHTYERFAPQTADGTADAERGVREFVVGTGGRSHYPFQDAPPNLEVRDNQTFGVLMLTLWENRYEWEFVPVSGGAFTDSGSAPCH